MTISTLTLFSGILFYATMNGESNGVLQTSSTGNKNNVIATAKEEVQLLVSDYATKYYEEKYIDNGKK